MVRRVLAVSVACSLGAMWSAGGSALAAVPHTVLPGETLWSISAANNLTTRTVAAYNGLAEDAGLIAGQTIQVPTVEEGAAALAAAGVSAQAPAAPATTTAVPAPGMSPIPSPYGDLYLIPAAAQAWNAMRAEALSVYGIDLYPGGPASAFRTYAQQAELYQAFLAGLGAPANPPGSSSHELGTAVDVPTFEMRSVIDQIGWKYGWGKVHAPGEWWHVDYLGGG
jgi:LAS superfamily LD-carboxypeptidase LdcB